MVKYLELEICENSVARKWKLQSERNRQIGEYLHNPERRVERDLGGSMPRKT
jgi:hypothetical protein